jgi:hypothetical protein
VEVVLEVLPVPELQERIPSRRKRQKTARTPGAPKRQAVHFFAGIKNSSSFPYELKIVIGPQGFPGPAQARDQIRSSRFNIWGSSRLRRKLRVKAKMQLPQTSPLQPPTFSQITESFNLRVTLILIVTLQTSRIKI